MSFGKDWLIWYTSNDTIDIVGAIFDGMFWGIVLVLIVILVVKISELKEKKPKKRLRLKNNEPPEPLPEDCTEIPISEVIEEEVS